YFEFWHDQTTICRNANKHPSSSHPASLVSKQDLESERTKLRAPAVGGTRAITPDVRDNLMAEIRNAGGLRALRKDSHPTRGLCGIEWLSGMEEYRMPDSFTAEFDLDRPIAV
ncbi:unnamed protein product, partial [Strongylus vulgaris]